MYIYTVFIHSPTHSLQFRFASAWDIILLFIGIISAVLNGVGFPVVMLVFGQLTDGFIDQAITASFFDLGNINDTVLCLERAFPSLVNTSDALESLALDISNGTMSCDAQYTVGTNMTSLEDIIPTCFSEGRRCLDAGAFTDDIEIQCYIFVGIAVAIFLLSSIQSLLFQLVAERQLHRIRREFYRAILRQDIGWFDANPSGELSSRLSE